MATEYNYFTTKPEWVRDLFNRVGLGENDSLKEAWRDLCALGELRASLPESQQQLIYGKTPATAQTTNLEELILSFDGDVEEALLEVEDSVSDLSDYDSVEERMMIAGRYRDTNPRTPEELLALPAFDLLYQQLNDDYRDAYYRYLALAPELATHLNTYQRRSYHSDFPYQQIELRYRILEHFSVYQHLGLNLTELFFSPEDPITANAWMFEQAGLYLAAILAPNLNLSGLDNAVSRDREGILDRIEQGIFEAEGVSQLSNILLQALIMSGHPRAIALVEKLLRAAKLSEGLRQSIIEVIDFGSLDTFKYFLQIIQDENLLRFSSVKRAFLTFGGLTDGLSDKTIPLVGQWLLEGLLEEKAEEYLLEKNYVKFYLGLYLKACHSVEDALSVIVERFGAWDQHQQIAALHFVGQAKLTIPGSVPTLLMQTINQIPEETKAGQEKARNLAAALLTNIPELSFGSLPEKRDFLAGILPLFAKVKTSARYHNIYGEGDAPFSSYYVNLHYRSVVLPLVDEVEDFYEEAYAVFPKYWTSWGDHSAMIPRMKVPAVHKAVVAAIGTGISDTAFDIIKAAKLELTHEDFLTVGDLLRLKSSTVRNNVAQLLKEAPAETILEVAHAALSTRNKNKRNGAIGILTDNYEVVKNLPQYAQVQELIRGIEFETSLQDQVAVLLGEEKPAHEERELFFTPVAEIPRPELNWDPQAVDTYLNPDLNKLTKFMNDCAEAFAAHHGETVVRTGYDGAKYEARAGYDFFYMTDVVSQYRETTPYDGYTFYEDFLPFTTQLSDLECLLWRHYLTAVTQYEDYGRSYRDEITDWAIKHQYLPDLSSMFKEWASSKVNKTDREYVISNARAALNMELARREHKKVNDSCQDFFAQVLAYQVAKERERIQAGEMIPLDDMPEEAKPETVSLFDYERYVSIQAFDTQTTWANPEQMLAIVLNLVSISKQHNYTFPIEVLFKLEDLGLIGLDLIYTLMLDPDPYPIVRSYRRSSVEYDSHLNTLLFQVSTNVSRAVNHSTNVTYQEPAYLEKQKEVYRAMVSYLVEFEIARTDSDTPYSEAISRVFAFYGAEVFLKTLSKMDKLTFVRGYSWGHEGKKEMFSKIIARTLPEEDLTQERFNELVKQYQIDNQRLLEACVYNLRFIEYAENYLKIPGLVKAAYFFKTHLNDSLSDQQKLIVRRYTDIAFTDFENGQMDLNWFKESYQELGENNFQALYDAAKYITDGGKHKRAQYFADAVRGKLKFKEVESRISDKRNQEMVLAYGLIPLGKGKSRDREKDLLHRYQKLQSFLAESKKFGSQRRASEALKVSIAMNNLARNVGMSINRFTWSMEAKLSQSQAEFFSPHQVDDYFIHIDLTRPEKPQIIVSKDDKQLKSVPGKISKNAYVKELKAVTAALKAQYRRARTMLEEAMCTRETFTPSALAELDTVPVVSALMRDLLFIHEGKVGFFRNGKLEGIKAEIELAEDAQLRIAHPVDLLKHDWVAWQNLLLEREIIQPFKQVFRELYTMTAEERKQDGYTQRFAGYQVAVNQTLGLLNSRGWMLNGEEGFEKVHHHSDLRIELYSYADWYTAGDVEAPSFEKVVFLDNKTGKTYNMAELDPIIFSETMRDLDLVVSVAHVGGVDPELNHTTIELRTRILEHNLGLFGVSNYQIEGSHITIKGLLHEYSMHLGSGVIHVAGRGMLPVFPVHSQQRGRIFLPFVDSDPKTAEIVSKALMLANDKKIKDPAILSHLR
ncbi:DUF4132 domain-containing protein [Arcanobacterium pinnipediorum]|uniref:DUF4132 domain-containing protein n=1 Tax=Arcanobacterium pinnipediorum TaxID=1503041 RepID=A0ABY5AJ20_9ACTO|nr:DUF4132 domain-containing protein [Arcanobacterium pinnipediorum]USR79751.1 DUF4132 domain-containing protein [Arcanobacterium pinnipediorum]